MTINAQSLGPIPPHGSFPNALPPSLADSVLEWAIANREHFSEATVTSGIAGESVRVDPSKRRALRCRHFGPLQDQASAAFLAMLSDVMSVTGASGAAPDSLELELTAYGDGAFFSAHLDLSTGQHRMPLGRRPEDDRIVSAVAYLHRRPRAFEGGRLRLYRFGVDPASAGGGDSVALAPEHNSMVAFPSWAMHAVEPVSCPSRRFEDCRFAINCWYCRPLAPEPLDDANMAR